jgi:hypothetical protein
MDELLMYIADSVCDALRSIWRRNLRVVVQKYQYVGTEVQMAMSADATCRGLRTATDGPYIMVFRKGRHELRS